MSTKLDAQVSGLFFGEGADLLTVEGSNLPFGNRWMDPTIGKWISEDPIGFEGGDPNLTRYCGNDAISSTDPTGLLRINPNSVLKGTEQQDRLPQAVKMGRVFHYNFKFDDNDARNILQEIIVQARFSFVTEENYYSISIRENYTEVWLNNSEWKIQVAYDDHHLKPEPYVELLMKAIGPGSKIVKPVNEKNKLIFYPSGSMRPVCVESWTAEFTMDARMVQFQTDFQYEFRGNRAFVGKFHDNIQMTELIIDGQMRGNAELAAASRNLQPMVGASSLNPPNHPRYNQTPRNVERPDLVAVENWSFSWLDGETNSTLSYYSTGYQPARR